MLRSMIPCALASLLILGSATMVSVVSRSREPLLKFQGNKVSYQRVEPHTKVSLHPRRLVKSRLTQRVRQHRQFKESLLKDILDREQELFLGNPQRNHHAPEKSHKKRRHSGPENLRHHSQNKTPQRNKNCVESHFNSIPVRMTSLKTQHGIRTPQEMQQRRHFVHKNGATSRNYHRAADKDDIDFYWDSNDDGTYSYISDGSRDNGLMHVERSNKPLGSPDMNLGKNSYSKRYSIRPDDGHLETVAAMMAVSAREMEPDKPQEQFWEDVLDHLSLPAEGL